MNEIPYERLLQIAKKMHLYIFINSSDELEVYEELGLTEEENAILGYLGGLEVNHNESEE